MKAIKEKINIFNSTDFKLAEDGASLSDDTFSLREMWDVDIELLKLDTEDKLSHQLKEFQKGKL